MSDNHPGPIGIVIPTRWEAQDILHRIWFSSA